MREIIFTGIDLELNIKNGHPRNVWRHGSLIEYDNGQMGIVVNASRYGFGVFINEVIPETVGQYTGLRDKNGKEIYEGDILQAEHFSYTGTYGLVVIKLGEYVDTGFLDDSNYEAQGVGFHAYLTKVKETCGIQKDMMQGMVIIGNTHENPELLEV